MLLLASWQPVPRLDPFCSCRYHRESKTDSREFSHSSLSSPLPLLTRRFLSNRIEFDILFDSLSSIISSVRRTFLFSPILLRFTFCHFIYGNIGKGELCWVMDFYKFNNPFPFFFFLEQCRKIRFSKNLCRNYVIIIRIINLFFVCNCWFFFCTSYERDRIYNFSFRDEWRINRRFAETRGERKSKIIWSAMERLRFKEDYLGRTNLNFRIFR